MSENLKNCPFCGSKADMWSWNGGVRIECSNFDQRCHLVSIEGKTEAEAIEKWNHRVERTAKVDFSESVPHCTACENPLTLCDNDKYCPSCGARLEF